MTKNVLISSAAGFLLFLLSWSRNSTPQRISAFPDFLVGILFILGLAWVIHFAVGRLESRTKSSVVRTGSVVTVTAGAVFAIGLALLAALNLSTPTLPVVTFAFGIGLGSAIVVGGIVTLVEISRVPHQTRDGI